MLLTAGKRHLSIVDYEAN